MAPLVTASVIEPGFGKRLNQRPDLAAGQLSEGRAEQKPLTGTERARDTLTREMRPTTSGSQLEKAAINAVLAGCRPEYLPIVLAAVSAPAMPRVRRRRVVEFASTEGIHVVAAGGPRGGSRSPFPGGSGRGMARLVSRRAE